MSTFTNTTPYPFQTSYLEESSVSNGDAENRAQDAKDRSEFILHGTQSDSKAAILLVKHKRRGAENHYTNTQTRIFGEDGLPTYRDDQVAVSVTDGKADVQKSADAGDALVVNQANVLQAIQDPQAPNRNEFLRNPIIGDRSSTDGQDKSSGMSSTHNKRNASTISFYWMYKSQLPSSAKNVQPLNF